MWPSSLLIFYILFCCSVWLATGTWTLGRLGVGIICSSVAAIFTNLIFSFLPFFCLFKHFQIATLWPIQHVTQHVTTCNTTCTTKCTTTYKTIYNTTCTTTCTTTYYTIYNTTCTTTCNTMCTVTNNTTCMTPCNTTCTTKCNITCYTVPPGDDFTQCFCFVLSVTFLDPNPDLPVASGPACRVFSVHINLTSHHYPWLIFGRVSFGCQQSHFLF